VVGLLSLLAIVALGIGKGLKIANDETALPLYRMVAAAISVSLVGISVVALTAEPFNSVFATPLWGISLALLDIMERHCRNSNMQEATVKSESPFPFIVGFCSSPYRRNASSGPSIGAVPKTIH